MEQSTLQTPVGMFSEQHGALVDEPEQAKFYKQLIPLTKPGLGEQFAFQVDLDRCTGCKACVSACHSLNGLDEDETWRDVGTIHGGGLAEASYTQTVTAACHHCADPACLNGCPVLAYEKDPETGIVRHLDDQCIGCQYCVLKCPYDVPKYSKALGIVRKCDMCHSRLAEGEAPACVQACPTEAIRITVVNTEVVSATASKGEGFLPAAPEPSYTVPTTQYLTDRKIPDNVEAADIRALRPDHGHFPLVIMLVLTQASVGFYLSAFFSGEASSSTALRIVGFIAMGLGLAASTSHLGRPLGAWRAFLGLRKSWLSREIVTFGGFSGIAFAYTVSPYLSFVSKFVDTFLGVLTILIGVIGVFTSVMIYHDTQRLFWRLPVTAAKFFGTTIGLCLTGIVSTSVFSGEVDSSMLWMVLLVFALKAIIELSQLIPTFSEEMTPARKSALLMLHPLRTTLVARYGFFIFGLLLMGQLFRFEANTFVFILGVLLLMGGEFLERLLFFKAVSAPKMPGGTS